MMDWKNSVGDDLHHYLKPLLQKSPDIIISHVGRNDFVNKRSGAELHKIYNFKILIQNSLPHCKVIIFNVINRSNDDKAYLTVKKLRNNLHSLELDIVDSSNIGKEYHGRKVLHIMERRPCKLATKFH